MLADLASGIVVRVLVQCIEFALWIVVSDLRHPARFHQWWIDQVSEHGCHCSARAVARYDESLSSPVLSIDLPHQVLVK